MKQNNIPWWFPYSGETCFVLGSSDLNDYLYGGFDNEDRDRSASLVLKRLINKYGNPSCGRKRAVFNSSKNYVIKFPLNEEGEVDNLKESCFKSKYTAFGKVVEINGFKCLIQEKINVINIFSLDENTVTFPSWIYMIDSEQVGYNNKGELKAYDFAEDISKIKDL